MVKVSPLRPVTTPDTRSKPSPCTLLPARTWLAEKLTLVAVRPFVSEASSVDVVSVAPSVHSITPFTSVGVEPSEHVCTSVVDAAVSVPSDEEVEVEVVSVPNASTITPDFSAAICVMPALPVEGVPLISNVVTDWADTPSEPAPELPKSNGVMPARNPVFELLTLLSGPRMRTVLLSRDCVLAEISGVTVTVRCATLTTFDAARLNPRLRRAELPRTTPS